MSLNKYNGIDGSVRRYNELVMAEEIKDPEYTRGYEFDFKKKYEYSYLFIDRGPGDNTPMYTALEYAIENRISYRAVVEKHMPRRFRDAAEYLMVEEVLAIDRNNFVDSKEQTKSLVSALMLHLGIDNIQTTEDLGPYREVCIATGDDIGYTTLTQDIVQEASNDEDYL